MNNSSADSVEGATASTGMAVRRRRLWKPLLVLVIVLLVLLAVAAVWGNRDTTPRRDPQTTQLSPQQLRQGEYLARAANCASCHTASNGQRFAGGLPLATGFGTIYGSNITSDPDHGIGRWTSEEFYRAVTRGTAPGGRQLYPAMPFVSYRQMTRADSDLLYGYLLSTKPSAQPNRAPDMPFPLNLRVMMLGWKTLFASSSPLPVASQGQSAEWKRGEYLGNVMGHCAECHTPRGSLGQLDKGKWLTGGALSLFSAPDLTAQALADRGWSAGSLSEYLRLGYSEQGSAFDEMHEVIANSTQHLSAEDNAALARFLLGDTPPAARAVAKAAPDASESVTAGRGQYMAMCSACHGAEGLGRSLTMPPLQGNSTVRQSDGRNLILAILVGLRKHPEVDAGPVQLPGMPGFADKLDDAQVRDLSNYVRSHLGGQPADIQSETVASLRAQAQKANVGIAP